MGIVLTTLRVHWEMSRWGLLNWFLIHGISVVLIGTIFVFGGYFGLGTLVALAIVIPLVLYVLLAIVNLRRTPPDPLPEVVNHRTDRLTTRRLKRSDASIYIASMDTQMLEANGWTGAERAREAQWVSLNNDIGRRCKLISVDSSTGEPVAFTSISFDTSFGGWAVGFSVAPEKRGKGYAVEALGGALDVFHQSGIDVVRIGTNVENSGMNAVIRRTGGVFDSVDPHRLPNRTVVRSNWYLHYG